MDRLQSMGLQTVGHNCATDFHFFSPPVVEVQSINCWNARKLPEILLQPIQVAKFQSLKILLLIRVWRKTHCAFGNINW